uniref:Uncharacterized protein n=1 Tax=Echeneis naucrates TaxID=173247 RepID=A0A665XAG0_ECHNA
AEIYSHCMDDNENSNLVPKDCCAGFNNLDYSKMDLKLMEEVLKHIDFYDSRFCIAVITIIFNPLFWNLVRTTCVTRRRHTHIPHFPHKLDQ